MEHLVPLVVVGVIVYQVWKATRRVTTGLRARGPVRPTSTAPAVPFAPFAPALTPRRPPTSDADRQAEPVAPVAAPAVVRRPATAFALSDEVRRPTRTSSASRLFATDGLATAVVLAEILAPPLALRGPGGSERAR